MSLPRGLADDPFDWSEGTSGEIRILRGGRTVCVVGGGAALRLSGRLAGCDRGDTATDRVVQLALAKASGNYKRGNERRPAP